jgi:hypothetical protein
MDPLKLYYYTSVPLLTCNILFYSVTTLSNSITSTQNVFKFVYEHKSNDFEIFKNEIESLDLYNKLKIIESLIFDIIKKYCSTDDEFNRLKENITNPLITSADDGVIDFTVINLENKVSIFERIEEPLRYALLITSEAVQNINTVINNIHQKVLQNNSSYLKGFINLKLTNELSCLNKNVKLLDIRIQILFDLLKVYIPKK